MIRTQESNSGERTERSLAFALGVGSVLYGLAELLEILHQAQFIDGWWTVLAVSAVFGPAMLLAGLAFVAPLERVRIAAGLLAVGYLAVAALALVAMPFAAVPDDTLWIYRVANLGAVAAVLVWRDTAALAYLLASVGLATLANAHGVARATGYEMVQDYTLALALSAVFAICSWSALRTAAALDRETAAAELRATSVAVDEARERERNRFAALTHDGVMSTLLEASRARETPVLARQAQRTLTQLDEFRSGAADAATVDLNTLLDFLRTTVQGANVAVMFTVRRHPNAGRLRMPVDVASTMTAALAEAVRNSARHAGSNRVDRQVIATVGEHDIRVAFVDDGVGFDPARVPTHRLGVAVSIVGRMEQIPGGSGTVESKPGFGTRVTLTWVDGASRA
ncbi:sensor histidine kinase [Skermania piniformis]|uniref:ATP-binding protein n=1 Tax=Skermania pinensis TaxID=39122 RepID=A0ABX8S631_9ACTN|nr:ATP-binding protein [Skermania piniformis]QXQ12612.1 ATP-binding protein [Skermania piniformis]